MLVTVPAAYPGLLLTMVGLVIAGPWLTAVSARWCARVLNGASPLLAARRLADNPRAAFRAARGLVLAVFLGTMVGALVPTPPGTAIRQLGRVYYATMGAGLAIALI